MAENEAYESWTSDDYVKKIKSLNDENAARRLANKELSDEMQNLSAKLGAIEEERIKKERSHLELADKYKAERDTFNKDLQKAQEKLTAYESRENARKESMLSKLPEKVKETFATASIEHIEALLDVMATKNRTGTGDEPVRPGKDWMNQPLKDMSQEDMRRLQTENPALFDKKLNTEQI